MAAPALTLSIQGQGVVPADLLNTFQQTCDTVGQLRGFVGTTGIEVLVRGLVTPGDGGGGTFYWATTVNATDDGVNYILPLGSNGGGWIRNLLSGAFGVQAVLASQATVDIGSVGTNNLYVTGITTITSFGTTAKAVNPVFLLRFGGVLTIKNSATVICPNGNDITTAANSIYIVQALGGATFVVTPLSSSSTPPPTYPGFGSQTGIVASATTNIGSVATHNVLVTGTTGITSFGSGASASAPVYLVQFQGVLTLTYNATSMILLGGGNITTAAGDVALMQYLGSGDWEMLTYQRATGQPLVSSGSTFHSQAFTVSGTFTVPPGTSLSTVFKFTVTGGGGSSITNVNRVGLAPGAGATAIYWASGLAPGSTVSITIGSGGTGGSGGGNSTAIVGATTVTGGGGSGGLSASALGGTAINGTINVNGGNGQNPVGSDSTAIGGASMWGTSGAYGAGASCSSSPNTAVAGTQGIVIVEWVL